jgi:pSer/pThr/pTyr-binding forkhead associated (FHA) protein
MKPPPNFPADSPPTVKGELVVRNGRLAGVRRPLTSPVMLIGRADFCDVRLNVDSVSPVHCVLSAAAGAFHLRDLGGGTLVNDKPFTEGPLETGDLLAIGPFQFCFEVSVPEGVAVPPKPAELEAERDALRIQAAAVVAQQAALAEQETQLRQGRAALERQKEQLATYLENRRKGLMEMQEQMRQDRAAFKTECEAGRQEMEQARQQIAQTQEESTKTQQQVDRERRRLIELRKRLKRRWHRHWDGEKAAVAAREQEVVAAREKLHQEAEALRGERAALLQAQLRFNGEVELGRRRLREEWQQLGLAQQQWEATLNLEQTRRIAEQRELDRRAAAVQKAERALADRQRKMEQRMVELTAETQGLEVRVRNQRLRLAEVLASRERPRPEAGARVEANLLALRQGDVPTPPVADPTGSAVRVMPRRSRRFDVPAVWVRLAGMLADQRRHLLEQWQYLLEVEAAWEAEHALVLPAVEAAGRQLREREEGLERREQALRLQEQAIAAGQADLRQRVQALSQVRCALEGWQAQLTAREAAWEAERASVLAEVQAREEAAAAAVRRLEEVHERRIRRRGEEIEALRTARERLEQLRQDYASLWQECQERRAHLAQEQRALAGQALALEDLRQELLPRTADPAAVNRRLERLKQRHAARLEIEERSLTEDRQALGAEMRRLDERNREVHKHEDDLMARHDEWARQVAAWEEQRLAAADAEAYRRQEVERLQAQRVHDQRQLTQLREELERIARLLLDESEVLRLDSPPATQAA